MSGDDHSEAREAMLGRLAALEVARKLERDKRKEEASERSDPRESIAKYLAVFSSQQLALNSTLETLKTSPEGGRDLKRLQEQLDLLTAEAFQMEKSSADASYFLPSYDLKRCTASVSDLKQRIEAARADLLPKRKFAFSKKVSRVKGADMSTTAAEANPLGAAPVSAGGTSAVAGAALLQSRAEAGGQASAHDGASTSIPGTGESASAAAVPLAQPSQQDIALVKAGQGFMGLRNQVVVLTPDQVRSQAFVLIDLQGCHVYLLGHMSGLRMMGLRDTTVVAGPVTGACFVDGAAGCTIILASYQVRIHCTTDTDFYVRARSKPIIEHTTRVRFAPFALELAPALSSSSGDPAGEAQGDPQGPVSCCHERDAQVQVLLHQHKLGEDTAMYQQVEDFGWIKSVHSPNWSLVPEAERLPPVKVPWSEAAKASSGMPAEVDEI